MEQKERNTIYAATFHNEYLLEQLSDHFYELPPGQRGKDGVYVETVYNTSLISSDENVHHSLLEKMPPIVWKFFDKEQDSWALMYYRIVTIGDPDVVLRDFLNRCVVEMCNRIDNGWLDEEDDHCDFFHSTLETLVQIAYQFNLTSTLVPLQNSIIANHVPNCIFDDGDCFLPNVMENYL